MWIYKFLSASYYAVNTTAPHIRCNEASIVGLAPNLLAQCAIAVVWRKHKLTPSTWSMYSNQSRRSACSRTSLRPLRSYSYQLVLDIQSSTDLAWKVSKPADLVDPLWSTARTLPVLRFLWILSTASAPYTLQALTEYIYVVLNSTQITVEEEQFDILSVSQKLDFLYLKNIFNSTK
jgi:hypothetical protein